MKTLVTGGIRSGKSAHAELLLADRDDVTYVATGRPARGLADPDWAERITAHRLRRPPAWVTIETLVLDQALREASGAVLIDSLGSWLAAQIDHINGWQMARQDLESALSDQLNSAVAAIAAHAAAVVVVTEEVGLGLVGEHRSGRLFTDLLGLANQRVATVCDEVRLVLAGRALVL